MCNGWQLEAGDDDCMTGFSCREGPARAQAIAAFTASTSCFMVKGLGRK